MSIIIYPSNGAYAYYYISFQWCLCLLLYILPMVFTPIIIYPSNGVYAYYYIYPSNGVYAYYYISFQCVHICV